MMAFPSAFCRTDVADTHHLECGASEAMAYIHTYYVVYASRLHAHPHAHPCPCSCPSCFVVCVGFRLFGAEENTARDVVT